MDASLICVDCGELKPAAEYYSSANGNPFRRCRQCTISRQKANRIERRERLGVQDGFSPLAQRFTSQRMPT